MRIQICSLANHLLKLSLKIELQLAVFSLRFADSYTTESSASRICSQTLDLQSVVTVLDPPLST